MQEQQQHTYQHQYQYRHYCEQSHHYTTSGMGTCLSIGRGRRDVGVECVPCAALSGEQDTEKEEEDEGVVGNDMQMNNNTNNNMNNKNMNNNNQWSS